MFFNVSGLVQEGIGATRTVDVEGTIQAEGRAPEHVIGTADLLRTMTGVLVRAHLSLVEPEVCSWCLKPLEKTIRIDFEEEFQSTVDIRNGEAVEEYDPDALMIDEHHMLDLTEAVRQYREVSGEMAPLCRPDCKGLCPNCGQDFNLGDCACDKGSIDARWSGLAALRGAILEGKD